MTLGAPFSVQVFIVEMGGDFEIPAQDESQFLVGEALLAQFMEEGRKLTPDGGLTAGIECDLGIHTITGPFLCPRTGGTSDN